MVTNDENNYKAVSNLKLDEIILLILNHPFFNNLKNLEAAELVELAFHKQASPTEVIVKQGEYVKDIYLILKGELEVSCKTMLFGVTESFPQTILRTGEMIGLNNGGFHHAGIHEATVTALTETVLIGWEFSKFNEFLVNHPSFKSSIEKIQKELTKIDFIKNVVHFENLSLAEMAWLAKLTQEISISKGNILFQQGEIDNKCYLIQSGKIEILLVNEDRSEDCLSVLESPMLLGESSLLIDSSHNATARCLEDSILLVINKSYLQTLIKHHQNTAESIMLLMVERSRPEKKPNISLHPRHTADGEEIFILKNEDKISYFQLSKVGWYVWQLVDGRKTLQEITIELFKIHKIFIPEVVADIVFNLADSGFVSLDTISHLQTLEVKKASSPRDIFSKINKVLKYSIFFKDIDGFLTKSYSHGIYVLFNKVSLVFMTTIIIIGIICFTLTLNKILFHLSFDWTAPLFILGLFLFTIIGTIFHELAHAYTIKFYNHVVHGAGLLISWLGFIAFVDTSDMWLANRRTRIVVSMAGAFVDMLIAGLSSIIAFYITQHAVAIFLWFFALIQYYSVYKNLNPLHENDGYHVLMDALDSSKVRTRAFDWLSQFRFDRLIEMLNIQYIKEHRVVLIYWIVCSLFLFVGILFSIIFQHYLRLILPYEIWGISTTHLAWIFPLSVVVFFLANIFMNIPKAHQDAKHQ